MKIFVWQIKSIKSIKSLSNEKNVKALQEWNIEKNLFFVHVK